MKIYQTKNNLFFFTCMVYKNYIPLQHQTNKNKTMKKTSQVLVDYLQNNNISYMFLGGSTNEDKTKFRMYKVGLIEIEITHSGSINLDRKDTGYKMGYILRQIQAVFEYIEDHLKELEQIGTR